MNLNPFKRERGNDQAVPVPFQDYVDWLGYQGTFYPFTAMPTQTLKGEREEVGAGFAGLTSVLSRNVIVSACLEARRSHFSEARFIYRQRVQGKAGDLFGTPDLAVLEAPYGPGSGPADLLSRMIQDVDLAGNSFHVLAGDRLARLRPDWVGIALASRTGRAGWWPGDPDTEVAGYAYWPGGPHSGEDAITFMPRQVAHFAPIYDPTCVFKGMSLLAAAVRDIAADSMMTQHLSRYLEQGATPNMIVKFPEISQQNFTEAVETIRRDHEGARNAYRTLFLTGGASAEVVGSNVQEADLRSVQGARETRICLAMRVPAVIVGVSEGLGGSALNAGNYQASRRMFADGVLRPLWKDAASSIANIVTVPSGAELYYDDTDVAFLREDLKERAEAQQMRASAWNTYVTGGMDSDAAVQALMADDLSRLLGNHNGLPSVQQQEPQSMNGQSNGKAALPVGGTA